MTGTRIAGQPARGSILFGGLGLVWRHPGAVVWTYVLNLVIALVFSLSLHARLASVLDHSMAAQGLNAAFDLGTLGAVAHQLGYRVPSAGAAGYAGLPIYFAWYFVLVPGALFSYRIGAPQRLAILVSSGLCFFWRFVRITLLTLLLSALVLGPLFALQNAWANHVDEHVVGVSALYRVLAGWLVIALVAAVLRIYFDLVEVYAVQLDDQYRENGKPDRRVRKVLIPAAKTLWANFWRLYAFFWYTTLKGAIALGLVAYVAVEMLAQPRVWPAFLLLQLGFFVSIFTRYWMRAAETVLVSEFPLPGAIPVETGSERLQPSCGSFFYGKARPIPVGASPSAIATGRDPLDAQPGPEPAAPSEDAKESEDETPL
jgi:hypothetical protein